MSLALILSLLVKSSLVALSGLIAVRLVARRPVDRVDILRATVVLLLALPVVVAVLPHLELGLIPVKQVAAVAPPIPLWAGETRPIEGVALHGVVLWPSFGVLFGSLWVLGAAVLTVRLGLGLVTLRTWTRAGRPVASPAWLTALAGLRRQGRPRLVSTDRVSGPLSWGVAPGVILIDPASLASPQAAPSILAHELAHLQRRDWVFLMLSRLALALFWFNPLVWRLHAELADASEDAADAQAIRTVDRRDYARTLVRLAASPSPFAATAMAAHPHTLKRRIASIMTNVSPRRRPLAVALTVAAMAAVATPIAALELHARHVPAPPAPPAVAPTPPLPPLPLQAMDAPLPPPPPPAMPALAAVPPSPVAPELADLPEPPQASPAPPARPAPPAPPAPPARPIGGGYVSYRQTTPQTRQEAAQARAEAAQARVEASLARSDAARARARAQAAVNVNRNTNANVNIDARAQASTARVQADQARAQAVQARAQADQARAQAAVARQTASVQMAATRVQMSRGADQMVQGAAQMRSEAARLRDPAYRAQQIQDNRRRGQTVTDQQLVELSRTLPARADELDRRAEELRRRSAERS